MPYTWNDPFRAVALLTNDLHHRNECMALYKQIKTINFSNFEAKSDMLAKLNDFINDAHSGSSIFSQDKRFPEDITDIYISSGSSAFSRLLTGLISDLSFRADNMAKDTEAGIKGKGTDAGSYATIKDQGTQDRHRAYYGKVEEFLSYINDKSNWVMRMSIEEGVATWTAAATS